MSEFREAVVVSFALGLMFVVLRAGGLIEWHWLWVTLPLWFWLCVAGAFVLCAAYMRMFDTR